ncbi:hypothetical protein NDU88_004938 [Pleurodeles waltl]|uniref:Uncharacterized protein n=1 Tax=Pleurodeles waltl TaxID=8319 RepID=A0AAV7W8Z2_PLEWA|nr:hypothetical protein NDU88_004938 [Pleurodeles waltl]
MGASWSHVGPTRPLPLLPSAGRRAGPTSRTPLPTAAFLFGAPGGQNSSRHPRTARGSQSRRHPGESPGVSSAQPRASSAPTCRRLQSATPHHCLRRRRSACVSGFRADLKRAPRLLPLRRTEVLLGTKIRRCRFPPDQTIPVCVISPAGPRGELYFKISCQARRSR